MVGCIHIEMVRPLSIILIKYIIVSGLTFDIPGTERDCQIYFLWTKKTREEPSEVSGRQEEINDPETEIGSGSGEPIYEE